MLQLTYLNLDVLYVIFEQLGESEDVSSMMKTCRILHGAGFPSLLRDIKLSTLAQLNSALACLLSPTTRRNVASTFVISVYRSKYRVPTLRCGNTKIR